MQCGKRGGGAHGVAARVDGLQRDAGVSWKGGRCGYGVLLVQAEEEEGQVGANKLKSHGRNASEYCNDP